MKKIKPILQLTRTECGICCLAMLTAYYGLEKPIRFFREKVDVGRDGVSISLLNNILKGLNFNVVLYKLSEIDFDRIEFFPLIVHTKKNHFLILEKFSSKLQMIDVIDPSCGRVRMPVDHLMKAINDFIIYATPNENFKAEKTKESIWKPFYFLIKKVRVKFLITLLLSVFTYLFSLAIPLLIQNFIDRFSINGSILFSNEDLSLVSASIMFFLLVSFFRNKIIVLTETIIDKSLLMELMKHIFELQYKYFETRTTGEILFRINLLNSIRLLLSEGLIRGILDAGSILFILAYMSIIAPALIAGVLLVLILIFIIANIINNRVIILNKEELTEQAQISNIETEAIEMMFDIKCLGVEELFLQRLKDQYEKFQEKFKRREMLSRSNVSLLQFFQLFIPFILLLLDMLIVSKTKLSIGMVVAFYTLSNMIITNCIALVQEVTNFRLMKNYIVRINDILYEKEDMKRGNKNIAAFQNLSVNNLSFQYSQNSQPLLKDINFSVEKGRKVAIVGGSGEGKSTLVKMLLGLYRPTAGEIKYNGMEITEINENDFNKMVGIMPQDARLFNGSIKYNITLGDDTISDEIVEAALKKANIYKDINKMPLKINTILTAGGSNLSGGQRQRIALARILVKNPQILILDEATSSLDGITEKEIMNVLNECKCTQIVVSHRFSTILEADCVFVIKDGSIIEYGTINELVNKSGLFMDLFGKQIEAYHSLLEGKRV